MPSKLARLCVIPLLLSCLCTQSQAQAVKQDSLAPVLGARMPCTPDRSLGFAIGSAMLGGAGCDVLVGGITYRVITYNDSTINWVSTHDTTFVTPEGVRVGDHFQEVQAKHGGEIFGEISWGFFSKLPSGWCARYGGFPVLDNDTLKLQLKNGEVLVLSRCDSTVYEIFQRRW